MISIMMIMMVVMILRLLGFLLILIFQIVSFLGKDRMVEFLGLKSNEERIGFMYRHEAYRPLLQVWLIKILFMKMTIMMKEARRGWWR